MKEDKLIEINNIIVQTNINMPPHEAYQKIINIINLDNNNLLQKALQFQKEQIAISNLSNSSDNNGILIGITRIVNLIKRHINTV